MAALCIGALSFGGKFLSQLMAAKAQLSQQTISVNDMIALEQELKSPPYSSVEVENSDDHVINATLVKSENVKTSSNDTQSFIPEHHIEFPSYKSGIIDWLYLLPGSSFTYNICVSSTTNYTQYATYFLFSGTDNYTKYTKYPNNGVKYSTLTYNLTALGNNRKTCIPISCIINSTDYYFMMLNSPGGVNISYQFSLHKVEYIVTNIEITSNFSSSVTLPLANHWPLSQTKYYIFVYAYSFPYEQSITTTVRIKDFTTSKALVTSVTLCFVLLFIFLIFALLFIGALIYNCKILHKKHHHAPTQATYIIQ